MSNDDYFAQRPAGDGSQPPPPAGQPGPYTAPAAPAVPLYGAPAPEYGAQTPDAQQPGYAYPAYGTPQYGTPQPGYGNPGYGYPYTARKTNGLAIASMIVSLVSLATCPPLLGLVGAIMGHVARRQVAQRNEDGAGMALAGIIIGWIVVALSAVILLIFIATAPWSGGYNTY
jgi:hypothetical protein